MSMPRCAYGGVLRVRRAWQVGMLLTAGLLPACASDSTPESVQSTRQGAITTMPAPNVSAPVGIDPATKTPGGGYPQASASDGTNILMVTWPPGRSRWC